jgi:hypothetical protein
MNSQVICLIELFVELEKKKKVLKRVIDAGEVWYTLLFPHRFSFFVSHPIS